ncbi:MAG: 50S ribosomal protein L25 [Bacteroidales bacterium]|nr:50S ribosomal protein L25 [Candidatus Liminaster caballi]
MKEYSLSGTKRAEAGKKAAKQLRAQGLIPCNLIGKDGAQSFTVKLTDLRNLLYTSQVYAVNLSIDGVECKAILKEAQFGPINEEVLHLDFLKFNADEPISVAIPVKLEGFAEGVKAGGKLVKQVRSLTVKGLYTQIPERLIVDVTPIGIGKTLNVASLKYENLEILNAPSVIVAGVKATRASRQNN